VNAAAVAAVDIGQAGAWVGPLVVGLLSGALDYSGAGPVALRDRAAVAGYYAAGVSFAAILGWTPFIRDQVTDYNWQMVGALISLVTHGALLICWVNWPRAAAKALSKKTKFASADSAAAKINQTLLGWTLVAALSAPLSGDGGWGHVVDVIATGTTGLWSAIVSTVLHWLGG
jgi:hypothetical protein